MLHDSLDDIRMRCLAKQTQKYEIKMTISAESASKKICSLGNWNVSNLQLQKLLYLSHMIFLGRSEGCPLISEQFEAWDYGPVVPQIYRKVKMYGSLPVRDVFYNAQSIDGTEERETLDTVTQAFISFSPSELVAITHWEDGAWAHHYRAGTRGNVIPNTSIVEEYRARINAQ